MTIYTYQGIDNQTGAYRKGRIKAQSVLQARKQIDDQGLTVLGVRALPDWLERAMQGSFGRKMAKPRDRAQFYRSVGTAFATQQPLMFAIESSLSGMKKSDKMRPALERLQHNINLGMEPPEALEAEADVIGAELATVYKASSFSDEPESAMMSLADITEQTAEIYAKVRGALTLPIIYLIAMIGAAIIITAVALPSIVEIYEEFEAPLPTLTSGMLSIRQFFTDNLLRTLLVMAGFVSGIVFMFRSPKLRLKCSKIAIKIPVIGNLQRAVSSQRICAMLGVMLSAEVPHSDSLGLAKDSMKSLAVKEMVSRAAESLRDMSFDEAVTLHLAELDKALPALAVQSVSGVSEAGTNWKRYGEFRHRETNRMAQSVADVMKQVSLAMVGVLLGFMAAAFYLPMFGVMQVVAEGSGL